MNLGTHPLAAPLHLKVSEGLWRESAPIRPRSVLADVAHFGRAGLHRDGATSFPSGGCWAIAVSWRTSSPHCAWGRPVDADGRLPADVVDVVYSAYPSAQRRTVVPLGDERGGDKLDVSKEARSI